MKINQPLTICGEKLAAPMHICAFFDSRDEQYDVILPYIKEGLENNECILNILEGSAHNQHHDILKAYGIDTDEKLNSNQLQVLASEDTYTKGGSFAAEKMYRMVEEALIDAKKAAIKVYVPVAIWYGR